MPVLTTLPIKPQLPLVEYTPVHSPILNTKPVSTLTVPQANIPDFQTTLLPALKKWAPFVAVPAVTGPVTGVFGAAITQFIMAPSGVVETLTTATLSGGISTTIGVAAGLTLVGAAKMVPSALQFTAKVMQTGKDLIKVQKFLDAPYDDPKISDLAQELIAQGLHHNAMIRLWDEQDQTSPSLSDASKILENTAQKLAAFGHHAVPFIRDIIEDALLDEPVSRPEVLILTRLLIQMNEDSAFVALEMLDQTYPGQLATQKSEFLSCYIEGLKLTPRQIAWGLNLGYSLSGHIDINSDNITLLVPMLSQKGVEQLKLQLVSKAYQASRDLYAGKTTADTHAQAHLLEVSTWIRDYTDGDAIDVLAKISTSSNSIQSPRHTHIIFDIMDKVDAEAASKKYRVLAGDDNQDFRRLAQARYIMSEPELDERLRLTRHVLYYDPGNDTVLSQIPLIVGSDSQAQEQAVAFIMEMVFRSSSRHADRRAAAITLGSIDCDSSRLNLKRIARNNSAQYHSEGVIQMAIAGLGHMKDPAGTLDWLDYYGRTGQWTTPNEQKALAYAMERLAARNL